MLEFADTNSSIYSCHTENASYQKQLTIAAVLVPLSKVICQTPKPQYQKYTRRL